jgi:hypothetical protein
MDNLFFIKHFFRKTYETRSLSIAANWPSNRNQVEHIKAIFYLLFPNDFLNIDILADCSVCLMTLYQSKREGWRGIVRKWSAILRNFIKLFCPLLGETNLVAQERLFSDNMVAL